MGVSDGMVWLKHSLRQFLLAALILPNAPPFTNGYELDELVGAAKSLYQARFPREGGKDAPVEDLVRRIKLTKEMSEYVDKSGLLDAISQLAHMPDINNADKKKALNRVFGAISKLNENSAKMDLNEYLKKEISGLKRRRSNEEKRRDRRSNSKEMDDDDDKGQDDLRNEGQGHDDEEDDHNNNKQDSNDDDDTAESYEGNDDTSEYEPDESEDRNYNDEGYDDSDEYEDEDYEDDDNYESDDEDDDEDDGDDESDDEDELDDDSYDYEDYNDASDVITDGAEDYYGLYDEKVDYFLPNVADWELKINQSNLYKAKCGNIKIEVSFAPNKTAGSYDQTPAKVIRKKRQVHAISNEDKRFEPAKFGDDAAHAASPGEDGSQMLKPVQQIEQQNVAKIQNNNKENKVLRVTGTNSAKMKNKDKIQTKIQPENALKIKPNNQMKSTDIRMQNIAKNQTKNTAKSLMNNNQTKKMENKTFKKTENAQNQKKKKAIAQSQNKKKTQLENKAGIPMQNNGGENAPAKHQQIMTNVAEIQLRNAQDFTMELLKLLLLLDNAISKYKRQIEEHHIGNSTFPAQNEVLQGSESMRQVHAVRSPGNYLRRRGKERQRSRERKKNRRKKSKEEEEFPEEEDGEEMDEEDEDGDKEKRKDEDEEDSDEKIEFIHDHKIVPALWVPLREEAKLFDFELDSCKGVISNDNEPLQTVYSDLF